MHLYWNKFKDATNAELRHFDLSLSFPFLVLIWSSSELNVVLFVSSLSFKSALGLWWLHWADITLDVPQSLAHHFSLFAAITLIIPRQPLPKILSAVGQSGDSDLYPVGRHWGKEVRCLERTLPPLARTTPRSLATLQSHAGAAECSGGLSEKHTLCTAGHRQPRPEGTTLKDVENWGRELQASHW